MICERKEKRNIPLADDVSEKIRRLFPFEMKPLAMVSVVLVNGQRPPPVPVAAVVVTEPPPPDETQFGGVLHELVVRHVKLRLPPTLVKPAAHVKTINDPPRTCVALSCVCNSCKEPVGVMEPVDVNCVSVAIGHRPVPG